MRGRIKKMQNLSETGNSGNGSTKIVNENMIHPLENF